MIWSRLRKMAISLPAALLAVDHPAVGEALEKYRHDQTQAALDSHLD